MGRSVGGCLAVAGHRHQWYIASAPESNAPEEFGAYDLRYVLSRTNAEVRR